MEISEKTQEVLAKLQKKPTVREWILAGHIPKDAKKIRDQYLAEHLPHVTRALKEAFEDGTITQKLKACELVMSYLWGKPQVEVNVSHSNEMVVEMIEEAKKDFIRAAGMSITGVEE